MGLAVPALADSRIRIDTVPATYLPVEGMYGQPVSMAGYRFEVNEETGRARVVVDYTYRDQIMVDQNANPSAVDPGPNSTTVQIQGLTWNPTTRSVVYEAGGKQTVCAVAQSEKHLKLKNTGSCAVTTTEGEHTTDDGWSLHQSKAIDTWLEVH
ncbi:MAG: hypothetical protein ABSH47_27585 [Bryobacteraceae bacterium]